MLLNITQFIFHASFLKINLRQTRHRLDFCTLSTSQTFHAVKTSGSIRTQHLHVVASSIAKLPDAFVSIVMADACSMVHLVCLFMKPHLLALL